MIFSKQLNNLPSSSSNSSENLEDLLFRINRLEKMALQKGIKVKTYSPQSLEIFSSLAVAKKRKIIDGLENYMTILSCLKPTLSDEGLGHLTQKEELECLGMALEEFGMETDDNNFDFISAGDIVEVYNFENIQLYRNLELLKINVYDLITVLLVSWEELYERPSIITKKIASKVQRGDGTGTHLKDSV